MCATFSRIFFLCDFFQPKVPKTKKTPEWGMVKYSIMLNFTYSFYMLGFIYIPFRSEENFLLVVIHVVLLRLIRIF